MASGCGDRSQAAKWSEGLACGSGRISAFAPFRVCGVGQVSRRKNKGRLTACRRRPAALLASTYVSNATCNPLSLDVFGLRRDFWKDRRVFWKDRRVFAAVAAGRLGTRHALEFE